MKYTESNIQLSEGDLVYIYTDGVTEAEDNDHNLFGDDRLLGCFENKNDSSPEEIIKDVKVSIENFIKGNSQFDDMTMLCFKWK
jgi:sigma-B regulation protein RsbU (phosphoserine phosphatase)